MISSIAEVSHLYDLFLVDLYGVVHDGLYAYKNAVAAVCYLKEQNKKVVFFSNSPRPKEFVAEQLAQMSSKLTGYDIFTSGSMFVDMLEKSDKDMLSFLRGKAFLITNDNSHPIITINNLNIADTIQEATYALIIAHALHDEELAKFDSEMKNLIERKIPAICPNPDLIANNGDGMVYAAGTFAKRYEDLGGVVHYIGKPHRDFYQFTLQGSQVDKNKILAVGDNINTDIKGAVDFGIDSLLILKGVHMRDDVDAILTPDMQPTYRMRLFAV